MSIERGDWVVMIDNEENRIKCMVRGSRGTWKERGVFVNGKYKVTSSCDGYLDLALEKDDFCGVFSSRFRKIDEVEWLLIKKMEQLDG